MIQTCNDEYWKGMEKSMPETGPCGRTFDDFDHLTYCPHEKFPGMSRSEIVAMQAKQRAEGESYHQRILSRLGISR